MCYPPQKGTARFPAQHARLRGASISPLAARRSPPAQVVTCATKRIAILLVAVFACFAGVSQKDFLRHIAPQRNKKVRIFITKEIKTRNEVAAWLAAT